MKYIELTVVTNHDFADIISAVLLDAGSEGTAIDDIIDIRNVLDEKKSWDYLDEGLIERLNIRSDVSVKGFFLDTEKLEKATKELLCLKKNNEHIFISLKSKELDDSDYQNEWKKYYEPFCIGEIAVVPSWMDNPFLDKKAIFIDPGAAFGTGTHASTRMCIELMQERDIKGKEVLDIGSGSGILALSALRLGAKTATLVDNDKMAIDNSRRNLEANGFLNAEYHSIGISELKPLGTDIVLANLTADILTIAYESITAFLKSGTLVILSGIIDGKLDKVLDKYSSLKLIKAKQLDGWNAVMLE